MNRDLHDLTIGVVAGLAVVFILWARGRGWIGYKTLRRRVMAERLQAYEAARSTPHLFLGHMLAAMSTALIFALLASICFLSITLAFIRPSGRNDELAVFFMSMAGGVLSGAAISSALDVSRWLRAMKDPDAAVARVKATLGRL